MKIIVAETKHENVYIDFTNPHEAYLKLFKLYDENEYYCLGEDDIKDEEEEAQELATEIEQLKAVNTKSVNEQRDKLEKQLHDMKYTISSQRLQMELYQKAKAGDGAAAEKLLKKRKDYEYEEWSIADVR